MSSSLLPLPASITPGVSLPIDLAIHRKNLTIPPQASCVFDGAGEVGGRTCRVQSLAAPARDLLRIAGAGVFAIAHEAAVVEVDPEPGAAQERVAEALLGPALALALARRGAFLLHAGAVLLPGRGIVGFLGDSGAGKSTLSRLLVEAGRGIALAADDLLAVELAGPGAVALPHVPQLKLAVEARKALAALASRHPLLGLYVLEPAPPTAAAAVGAPVPPAAAAALFVHHTIAGILFPADLLAAHFGFVTRLALQVPLRRLTVPRRLDVGAEVLRCLEGALSSDAA